GVVAESACWSRLSWLSVVSNMVTSRESHSDGSYSIRPRSHIVAIAPQWRRGRGRRVVFDGQETSPNAYSPLFVGATGTGTNRDHFGVLARSAGTVGRECSSFSWSFAPVG